MLVLVKISSAGRVACLLTGMCSLLVPGYSTAQSQSNSASPCSEDGQKDIHGNGGDKGTSKSKTDRPADPCPPQEKEPTAADKFPFPGSASAPPLPGAPTPQANSAPEQNKQPSAADQHPFPGSAPPMPGAPGSSSSSDGYSSSKDDTTPAPTDDPPNDADKHSKSNRRLLPKVKQLQSDEDRADEDLHIAKFYENKGDLNAAYLRLQDAVKHLPEDAETHYALARMAQKLNKLDEAITEYGTYLKLEPDGENVKEARKSLDGLKSK